MNCANFGGMGKQQNSHGRNGAEMGNLGRNGRIEGKWARKMGRLVEGI